MKNSTAAKGGDGLGGVPLFVAIPASLILLFVIVSSGGHEAIRNLKESTWYRSGPATGQDPSGSDSSADMFFIWTDLATPFSKEALSSVRSAAAGTSKQRALLLCMTLSCYESRYSLPESVDVRMISVRQFLGAEAPAAGWFR